MDSFRSSNRFFDDTERLCQHSHIDKFRGHFEKVWFGVHRELPQVTV